MRGTLTTIVLAAGIVVAIILLGGGGGPAYMIRVPLADADGLRDGAQIVRGGTQIGTVQLVLGDDDQVQAQLDFASNHPPIPQNSEIAISAVNLLGLKDVEVIGGDTARPAPNGYTMPSRQVMVGTDLDQVLDVLAPSTRTRLAVLFDEAGLAVMGRKANITTLAEELPPTLQDGSQLLTALGENTTTLQNLVVRSDQLVSSLAAGKTNLQNLVSGFARLSGAFASERTSVAATLDWAPGALQGLRTLLGQLRTTATALRPAAQNISATAPLITGVLNQLPMVRSTAVPALNRAVAVSPKLESLATTATPILQQASPTAAALAGLTEALQPISRTLDLTGNNLFAIIDNWSHAVEGRDSLGHVFRGEASFAPQAILSILGQPPTAATALRAPAHQAAPAAHAAGPSAPPAASTPAPASGTTGSAGSVLPPVKLPTTAQLGQGLATGLQNLLGYLLKR